MFLIDALADRVHTQLLQGTAPTLLAICGWADTGKSTLAAALAAELRHRGMAADCVSTDAFMHDRAERNQRGLSGYNPLSIQADELRDAIDVIASGQTYDYYPYDNRSGSRTSTLRQLSAKDVLIIEGIHAFHPQIADRLHLKILIDADETTMRALRLSANQSKRGMSRSQAGERIDHDLNDFNHYIRPQKALADLCLGVTVDFEYAIRHPSIDQHPPCVEAF